MLPGGAADKVDCATVGITSSGRGVGGGVGVCCESIVVNPAGGGGMGVNPAGGGGMLLPLSTGVNPGGGGGITEVLPMLSHSIAYVFYHRHFARLGIVAC